jgi:hypothetical protein
MGCREVMIMRARARLGLWLQQVDASLVRLLGIVFAVVAAVGLFRLLRGGIRRIGSKRTVIVRGYSVSALLLDIVVSSHLTSSPPGAIPSTALLLPCPFPAPAPCPVLSTPVPIFLPLPGVLCPEAPPLPSRFCNPPVSRSSSLQWSTDAISESISKRFASARGVVRNCKSRFVTSRRSTDASLLSFRIRRSASVRCSFRITAAGATSGESLSCAHFVPTIWCSPSCRSLPMRRFFSFTSFSSD